MQAALAGLMFQHGCHERAVVRHDFSGLFRRDTSVAALGPAGLRAALCPQTQPLRDRFNRNWWHCKAISLKLNTAEGDIMQAAWLPDTSQV